MTKTKNLSCPMPENTNPLYISNFAFSVHKAPKMTFFVQSANLPDISLGEASVASPLLDWPEPGDKINFGQFSCTFMVDERMENFKELTNWMLALGYPDDHDRFTQFMKSQDNLLTERLKTVSDATLGILGANLQPIATYTFIDCFPVSISGIQFDTTVTDATPIKITATFAYSNFELKTIYD